MGVEGSGQFEALQNVVDERTQWDHVSSEDRILKPLRIWLDAMC